MRSCRGSGVVLSARAPYAKQSWRHTYGFSHKYFQQLGALLGEIQDTTRITVYWGQFLCRLFMESSHASAAKIARNAGGLKRYMALFSCRLTRQRLLFGRLTWNQKRARLLSALKNLPKGSQVSFPEYVNAELHGSLANHGSSCFEAERLHGG